jgi:hypothetical protein
MPPFEFSGTGFWLVDLGHLVKHETGTEEESEQMRHTAGTTTFCGRQRGCEFDFPLLLLVIGYLTLGS